MSNDIFNFRNAQELEALVPRKSKRQDTEPKMGDWPQVYIQKADTRCAPPPRATGDPPTTALPESTGFHSLERWNPKASGLGATRHHEQWEWGTRLKIRPPSETLKLGNETPNRFFSVQFLPADIYLYTSLSPSLGGVGDPVFPLVIYMALDVEEAKL